MLVTLSNLVTVNPHHVASILVDDDANRLTLRMHDGEEFSLPCQYGKSIWLTSDDLVATLNAASEKPLVLDCDVQRDLFTEERV